jgi:hypothetical protein
MHLDSIVENEHNESDESPEHDDEILRQQQQQQQHGNSMNVLLPDGDAVSISIPQHYDDDTSSVGSFSTNHSSWTTDSPRSAYGKTTYQNLVTTDRLAKFEQEQVEIFQKKRDHMERELFNVLERNAAKSVRTTSCLLRLQCSLSKNANTVTHYALILGYIYYTNQHIETTISTEKSKSL